MKPQRIAITGANGFVGRALCDRLFQCGFEVRAAVRTKIQKAAGVRWPVFGVGTIDSSTDWNDLLSGADAVIHLAARTHVMNDRAEDRLALYRAINVEGSERLAQQAARAGVRRFIFMSSIKVNGESTSSRPFSETDEPHPSDEYGISKLEAERRLQAVCADSGMELTVLRPPLIYGFGVKGNLHSLMRALDRGWPMPLGSIHNQRSLIGLGNLVNAVELCLTQRNAAGATFLLCDDRPVSSAELVLSIARALGKRTVLLPVPVWALNAAGRALGKTAAIERLTSSLLIDSTAIRERLGWRPIFSFEQGIADMVKGYRHCKSRESTC